VLLLRVTMFAPSAGLREIVLPSRFEDNATTFERGQEVGFDRVISVISAG